MIRQIRISVDELYCLIQEGAKPLILDVRSAYYRTDGSIPGSVLLDEKNLQGPQALNIELSHEVVVYCACPNDASAARVVQRLKALGYTQVRPLHGGIDAWVAAGHPIELLE